MKNTKIHMQSVSVTISPLLLGSKQKVFFLIPKFLFLSLKHNWEGYLGGRRHGCTYGWFLLMYDRKPQNSVKQLPFKKEKKSIIG